MQECWTTAPGVLPGAISVHEMQYNAIVRLTASHMDSERFGAHCLAGRGDPLLPLVGVLWFGISVQQQVSAERTAATLARDLKDLARGFALEDLRLFDFYPQTAHIEAVAKLRLR